MKEEVITPASTSLPQFHLLMFMNYIIFKISRFKTLLLYSEIHNEPSAYVSMLILQIFKLKHDYVSTIHCKTKQCDVTTGK